MSLDVTKELGQNFIEYSVAVNTDAEINQQHILLLIHLGQCLRIKFSYNNVKEMRKL